MDGTLQSSRYHLESVARTLSADADWAQNISDAVLVVREGAEPTLALLGVGDTKVEDNLMRLREQLQVSLTRLRYVDYAQVEKDCERLAAQLQERLGESLRRFRFVSIPRGGYIVLGMLSYALGLDQEQLGPAGGSEETTVVVDDCAITGARFGRFLRHLNGQRVVFASLYSHPDLRSAIESREDRVVACLSAQDLNDHGPENMGGDYAAWKKKWKERSGEDRYWVGQPDHICFPWNEPDVGVWNPDTGQVERGWHAVPPSHCLKNRSTSGDPSIPVQVQPEGKGPLKPAEHILFGDIGERIVVANVESQESFGLADVAADIWRSVVKEGDEEGVVASLRNSYDITEEVLRADVQSFVSQLVTKGLLVRDV